MKYNKLEDLESFLKILIYISKIKGGIKPENIIQKTGIDSNFVYSCLFLLHYKGVILYDADRKGYMIMDRSELLDILASTIEAIYF